MHDYTCPLCPFESSGHPTKKAAAERGKQHRLEHETGEPMPELASTQED